MAANKMIIAGVCTLLQAIIQIMFTAFGIAQYFCLIDFLRGLPLLLYIKILYFHNPDACGNRVEIGAAIDGIADQAFVLQTSQTFTGFRTLVLNSMGFGLAVLWLISSGIFMRAGAKNKHTKCARQPWIVTTVTVTALDLVASITYANDTFHTKTLNDIMDFIGSVASGIGNTELDTAWAAWLMVLIYSRFIVLFVLNIILVIIVILDHKTTRHDMNTAFIEDPAPEAVDVPQAVTPASNCTPVQLVSTAIQASGRASASVQTTTPLSHQHSLTSEVDDDITSLPSESRIFPKIPRAGLSRSFRLMKTFLFRRSQSDDRVPTKQQFTDIPLETPRRKTNGESSETPPERRRGTTAGLQGQLPWAYIPASAFRMRDQLPSDEDLPPVPLPDYTAIQSDRKTSVHRGASNLSLLRKADFPFTNSSPKSRQTPFNQSDVLY